MYLLNADSSQAWIGRLVPSISVSVHFTYKTAEDISTVLGR